MGKKLISIATLALMLFSIFVMNGCGSPYDPYDDKKNPVVESECGNFYIQLYNEDKNGVKKGNAVVLELTEIGKQKEVLAIPSRVEGKLVTQIGLRRAQAGWGEIFSYYPSSVNLRKLYVPYNMIYSRTATDFDRAYTGFLGLETIILMLIEDDSFDRSVVIFNIEGFLQIYKEPNLKYRYNYDGSPNYDYFWLDYLADNNLYIEAPQPSREGYDFTGWYLEPECTTQWDGILPVSETENLSLYAGWNKN